MKKLLGWATLALILLCVSAVESSAQQEIQFTTCGVPPRTLAPGDPAVIGVDLNGNLCVSASVSASITGFAPAGQFATITATGSSASVALPTGAVVLFQNTGTTAVSCTLGIGSATAVASQNIVQPGSWIALTVGSNTFGACIDQTGSTSNVVVLSAGSGLPTGAGGGSSAGGSSAITTWAGGALGAMANYGTSPGAVLVPGMNAFITNTPSVAQSGTWNVTNVSGTVSLPTGAATSANQTTELASLSSIDTKVGSAIPAGTNNIGKVQVLGNAGAAFDAAVAAAPAANAVQQGVLSGGATGGLIRVPVACDSHVFKHITSATDTLAVQGVTSQVIYICSWRSRAAGVATWYLENTASVNANCSSTLTQITGVATEAANTGETRTATYWDGLKNTSGNGLCINSTGTGGVDIDLWYTQF